ncbi:hypothetical protein SAMN05421770_101430 [Granulicella rosea]|uniref:DUF2029 domain-containing protein n=2 Tax=Granulicella rosea TaxID=474952 RepID=A0A239DFE2_9BACT|nr:hypothetical protein SAMN05421770_101430 [Granulicella rosea]
MTSAVRTRVLITAICLLAILSLDVWIHGSKAAALFSRMHLHALHALEHPFWDSEPYATGIDSYLAGRSPYTLDDLNNPLPFAYPPVFVWAGAALAHLFPATWGWRLYIAVNLGSILVLECALAWLLLGAVRRRQWVALACMTPLCSIMSTVFLSGNIHVVWYAAALLAAIPAIRRRQWGWFYAVAFLAGVNQPIFLVLLLFPIFAGRRQYFPAAGAVLATGAVYLGERLFVPEMYSRFQASIANHLAASHDFGQGVFGIAAVLLARVHVSSTRPAVAIQLAFAAAVYFTLLWLRGRIPVNDRRWWALLALAIVLINPRIMPYDAALGLIPSIYFFLYALRPRWQAAIVLPVALASVALHSIVGFTLVLLTAFCVGVWQAAGERVFEGPMVGEEETAGKVAVSA